MRRFLLIPLFLALTAVLIFVFIWPKYQNLGILKDSTEEKKSELKTKADYFSRVREISADLQNYQEELSKISSAIPAEPSLPSLFDFLQKTSSETGLILKNIKLDGMAAPSSQSATKLKEINVSLDLEGSYSAFKSFLSAIEQSSKIINVRDILLKAKEGGKEPLDFNIKLKTQSY